MSALPDAPGPNFTRLNDRFEHLTTEEILRWVWQTFGDKAAASSSFQTQSTPLLHIISQVCPALPVIFIDTGFHFPETLTFRDALQERFDLNIVTVRAQIDRAELFRRHGQAPYRSDPDLCCYINKVEPMQRALAGASAWVSGVRRDQTAHRRNLPPLKMRDDGILRVHPMLCWTERDIWTYINRHDLPTHPLISQGYASIGCAPCTRPVNENENARAGRWAGTDKSECGLHLDNDSPSTP